MRIDKIPPQYPPTNGIEYFISILDEIGWCQTFGGEVSVLSWGEINSWKNLGNKITAWESEVIHFASSQYVGWLISGREDFCSPPYEPEEYSQEYIDAKNRKIEMAFS